jgi:V8-like Glu-specific endopeptidase
MLGWGGCSGTFFEDTSTVITAGHCLYNHDVNQLANEIIIIPAEDDGAQPYGSKNAINWATNNAWINFEDYRQDWGVIKVGSFSGPYSMGYIFDASGAFYYGNEFATAGYPADLGYPGNEMWWELDGVDYVDSRLIRLEYNFGTDPYYCIPGQSGSSIYYQDGSQYLITAILTLASCHSVRLDQSIVNFVQSFNNGCDGCFIDDSCYEDGDFEQGNPCRWCDVDQDAGAWTTQDGQSCDDGFFCNGGDQCDDGECVGSGDPCEEGSVCDENLNQCVEDGNDDDDSSADGCAEWMDLIYNTCGLTLAPGGHSVSGQSAFDSCNDGASAFDCVEECVHHENVDNCSTLAGCLLERCDIDTITGGGGDDDDDDDGGSCGF